MPNPSYILDQHYKGSARLMFQHWCANVRHGYLIHPSIQIADDAVIAEIGCGTGAWMIEVAQNLPRTTKIDGFDVDLSQMPHEKWLPENVRALKVDIYEPLPEELLGRYDLIHIRYFGICISNAGPLPIMRTLHTLLKPGGSIQWTENDLWADHIAKVSPSLTSTATEKLYEAIMKPLAERFGPSPGWAQKVPELLESCGFVNANMQYHTPPKAMWPAIHDNFLMGWEEVAGFQENEEEIRELLREVGEELRASGRGLALVGHTLTVVARKLAV